MRRRLKSESQPFGQRNTVIQLSILNPVLDYDFGPDFRTNDLSAVISLVPLRTEQQQHGHEAEQGKPIAVNHRSATIPKNK